MVRKLLQTLTVVLAVLFLMATVALAAEMTCTVADANGCTIAKGGDGKEEKVTVLSQILLRRSYRGSYPCLCGDYAARE